MIKIILKENKRLLNEIKSLDVINGITNQDKKVVKFVHTLTRLLLTAPGVKERFPDVDNMQYRGNR